MNTNQTSEKSGTLTLIGMLAMIVLTVVKAVTGSQMAANALILSGIALFFIVEALEKTPDAESGLSFPRFLPDLKRPGVIPLILLSVGLGLAELLADKLLFHSALTEHVLGRADIMTSKNLLVVLVNQVFVVAGEEIGFRGFFLGKGMKRFPFRYVALVSALVFAAAHFTAGPAAVVARDLAGIFVDAVIFALLYRKTNNCLIPCVPHFCGNLLGYLLLPVLLA